MCANLGFKVIQRSLSVRLSHRMLVPLINEFNSEAAMINQRLCWRAALVVLMCGAWTARATAQHFTGCAFNTGGNATVILPTDGVFAVDEASLADGDEVAVFTSDGICAGSGVWAGETLTFAVWGDDAVTPDKDGLLVGEPLVFRVWTQAGEQEFSTISELAFSSARAHYTPHGQYVENGIFVVSTLRLTRSSESEEFGKSVSSERQVPNGGFVTLGQNYPNPFNPSTTISYELARATNVRLTVQNVLGQTIRELYAGRLPAGEHRVQVEMSGMPSGLYLYRIETPEQTLTRTMLLSK